MKFYNQVLCRRCELKICDCKCQPIPCPFCNEEFGFTQDWNIHLLEEHKILGPEVIEKKEEESKSECTARLIID